MLAFTNTKLTKDQLLARLQSHYDADEIIKGQYWQDGRGCAVGCAIHGRNHADFESYFGIPQSLAHLQDVIFEGLPDEIAKEWPLDFSRAIRPGADLSKVSIIFTHWILTDPEHGVKKHVGNKEFAVAAAIDGVATLLARLISGESPSEDDWSAAWSVAWIAWSEVESARVPWSARSAASATLAAAAAAAWAAARAAWAAASAASRAASAAAKSKSADSAAYITMRDKLLELLSDA